MFVSEMLNNRPIAEHMLLRAIGEGKADTRAIYNILANGRDIATTAPSWFEALIDRAPNAAFKALLARQLDDELGHGDVERRFSVRLDRLLSALEPMVGSIDSRELEPGRNLLRNVRLCLFDPSFYASLGALVAAKYRSEEFGTWLEIVMRQQPRIAGSRYSWVTEFADIQAHHTTVGEFLLAVMTSKTQRAEASRGAREFDACLWACMDEMLQLRRSSVAA